MGFSMLTSLRDFSGNSPLSSLGDKRSVWTEAPKENFNDSFYDITVEEVRPNYINIASRTVSLDGTAPLPSLSPHSSN